MSPVERIRELLAPLSGDEDSYLRVQVGDDPERSPAELLYGVVFDPSFNRGSQQYLRPRTVEEFARALQPVQVTESQMSSFLAYLCTRELSYHAKCGPWGLEAARTVVGSVIDQLLPGVQWWSNVEYSAQAWEEGDFLYESFLRAPVTGHVFDCAVVGIGSEATVVFLSYAND
ncbi:hypothetical protein [Actinomadura sp. 3N508]|uniref:hypothetical protein n=1 Tax=Actinomadura sp. 3N508 TaxID=3375153 RepID=UPI0037BDDD00